MSVDGNDEKTNQTFGEFLNGLRQREGRGLRETARAVGVSACYISRIENGQLAAPADLVLYSLCTYLNVSRPVMFLHARRVPRAATESMMNLASMGLLFEEIDRRNAS